jgi:outer membrane protein assembly factor BamA
MIGARVLVAAVALCSCLARAQAPSPILEPAPSSSSPSTSSSSSTQLLTPPAPEAAPSTSGPRIEQLRLTLSDPKEGELDRLEGYLRDLLGRPATGATREEAVLRLDRLRRYQKALCRTENLDAATAVLTCTLRRTRLIRSVTVETRDVVDLDGVSAGLPLSILEAELKKRVLLRAGEPLDDESVGRTRIARQRARIEDFLEREGFYKAQVKVDVRPLGDDEEDGVDVVIRVVGGAFVDVRRVNVIAFGPLSQQRLMSAFSNMCASSEGWLDAAFLGRLGQEALPFNCYNRRRQQATVDRFVVELKESGYPAARVRVTPTFIDPRGDDPDCALGREAVAALTKKKLPLPPQCVDLDVEVIAGNHVTTRFHLEDARQPLVDNPPYLEGTARFARDAFEAASRAWQLTFNNPLETAADTVVVTDDMVRRLTFDDAGSADEAEAALSAEGIRGYLNERGYPSPEIDTDFVAYDDGDVAIDYTIRPGAVVPVVDVTFLGNVSFTREELLDNVELATQPRSWQQPGFLAAHALDDDVLRLRAFYGAKGFPEAEVNVRGARDERGDVHVVFTVDEGERFLITGVVFAGGDTVLTRSVLAVLAHCQEGEASVAKREAIVGDDCKGNPLIPDEMDADARRVEAVYAANGFPAVEAAVELGFTDAGSVVRVSVFPAGATGEARSAPLAGNVQPLVMGEIFVEGNLTTRREVLLREMGLDSLTPGSRLDPQALSRGVTRLRRTGLYSRVDLELVVANAEDDAGDATDADADDGAAIDSAPAFIRAKGGETAHVRVAVEERPASTVDVSLGFSSQQLFSLRLEGRNKNLFGSMFDASAAVDMGLFIGRQSAVRTQLRLPRLLGSDLSLSYSPVTLSYRDDPAGNRTSSPTSPAGQKVGTAWDLPDFRRRLFTLGSSVSLDWRAANIDPLIDDKLTVGVAVEGRVDWLDVKGSYFAPLSLEAVQTVDGMLDLFGRADPVPLVSLTPRVAWADIDNPFDPKVGGGAEFFVRTVPFVDVPYAVVGASARAYRSILSDRITFAGNIRTRWGIVGDATCKGDDFCEWALVQNDLLRIGGERTVRGVVEENSIGVESNLYDQNLNRIEVGGVPDRAPRPGMFGVVANGEVRFSLIPQLFIGELKPAVFMDIGLSTDDANFAVDDLQKLVQDPRYAATVGIGLRYVLPVGPLAFDIAYSPFDQLRAKDPFDYYLMLGYIF